MRRGDGGAGDRNVTEVTVNVTEICAMRWR